MTAQIQEIIDCMLDDPVYEDDAVLLKTYIERFEKLKTPDWFSCLTTELFELYSFEWGHDKSQEENCRAFIKTIEQCGWADGYEEGRFDERFQED